MSCQHHVGFSGTEETCSVFSDPAHNKAQNFNSYLVRRLCVDIRCSQKREERPAIRVLTFILHFQVGAKVLSHNHAINGLAGVCLLTVNSFHTKRLGSATMPATVQAVMVTTAAPVLDMRALSGNTMTKKRSAAMMDMKRTLAVTAHTACETFPQEKGFLQETNTFHSNETTVQLRGLLGDLSVFLCTPFVFVYLLCGFRLTLYEGLEGTDFSAEGPVDRGSTSKMNPHTAESDNQVRHGQVGDVEVGSVPHLLVLSHHDDHQRVPDLT